MRILYVTPLVVGFEDLLRGKQDSRGLPSFIFPLKALLDAGHTVDIILISNYREKIDIRVSWVSNENIAANINNDLVTGSRIRRFKNRILSFAQLYSAIKKQIQLHSYDFIYCHGTSAFAGNILANKYHIRCGYRLYGTVHLADSIKNKGRFYTIRKNMVYYLIFWMRKEFMLITDDGSEGDFVYRALCKKEKYKFYFWINGVDKSCDFTKASLMLPEEPYIFHAGRISRIKRQDRIIQVLRKLHQKGIPLHAYFAGHISEEDYKKELDSLIDDTKMKEYVHFLGDISRIDMQNMARHAAANVLLGDISNRGNVFYEMAVARGLIITLKNRGLESFIISGQTGFEAEDEDDVCQVLETIMQMDQTEKECILEQMQKQVDCQLKTWEERVAMEIALIENKDGVS